MIDSLRPSSATPKYPSYHDGYYLEEYFFHNKGAFVSDRQYIDVFWTNIYSNRSFAGISNVDVQSELNKLDPNGRYYTVCQNDDGVLEHLPKDTLKFCAGGNRIDDKTIAIPLLSSPIQNIDLAVEKDLLASFVGSNTHPLRAEMHKSLRGDSDIQIRMKNWSLSIPQDAYKQFVDLSTRSKFMLAPRGYGKTSFRLYEAFQFNCIPVYISDEFYLPYADVIDWSDFAVLIQPEDVKNVRPILLDLLDSGRYGSILENIRGHKELFTMDYMVEYIKRRLIKGF